MIEKESVKLSIEKLKKIKIEIEKYKKNFF